MNMFSGPPKREPSAQQRQGAGELHAMYTSYVEAGFTKQQAMEIILTIIQTGTAAGVQDRDKRSD